MSGEEKFWIQIWRICAPVVIVLILSFPVYYGYRNWVDLQLQQNGYSASQVYCMRKAGSSASNSLMCREVFLEKANQAQEKESP